MTRKRLAVGITLAATVFAFSACSAGGGGDTEARNDETLESMEPITLIFSEQLGPEAAYTAGGEAFRAYVEEETGGKVTFETHYAASLFPSTEALSMAGQGVADIAHTAVAYHPEELPVATWMVDFGSNMEQAWPLGFGQISGAYQELVMEDPDIAAELASQNVQLISHRPGPAFNWLCRDEIATLDEANGVRSRTGSAAWAEEAEAIGAIPEFTPSLETYESLQRGILDCAIYPPHLISDLSLWDVAKYFSDVPFSSLPGNLVVMNADKWEALPDEVKQIFMEAAAYDAAAVIAKTIDVYADFAETGPAEHGVTVFDAPELDEAVQAVLEERVSQMAADAPAGVTDPEETMSRFKTLSDTWHRLLTEAGVPSETSSFEQAASDAPDLDWRAAFEQRLLESVEGKYADR